jgi:hypothetical protein
MDFNGLEEAFDKVFNKIKLLKMMAAGDIAYLIRSFMLYMPYATIKSHLSDCRPTRSGVSKGCGLSSPLLTVYITEMAHQNQWDMKILTTASL